MSDYAAVVGPVVAFVIWVNWGWNAVRLFAGIPLLALLAGEVVIGQSHKLVPLISAIVLVAGVLLGVESVDDPFVNNEPEAKADAESQAYIERANCRIVRTEGCEKFDPSTTTTSTTSPFDTPTTYADAQAPVEPTCPSPGTTEHRLRFIGPPPLCIDPAQTYVATVVTNYGSFDITLDSEVAPNAVNNFVFLAGWNFFDGVAFEHTDPRGILRLSDPVTPGTGKGGPGYELNVEAPPSPPAYQHMGVIMASGSQEGHSHGSQFVIVMGLEEKAQLRSAYEFYTFFGEVSSGGDHISNGGTETPPTSVPIVIEDVVIREQP
ncbi:MAG TPA: peptidylprolyl isomerase [Acidimicrobiales bacterium]